MSVVHLIAIMSAVFCVICSLLMFVSDASGDYMAETYSNMRLVIALYVARIVSFCFPHVVDVSSVFCWVWCKESACCFVWVESESMYVYHVGIIGCLLLLCLYGCVLILW